MFYYYFVNNEHLGQAHDEDYSQNHVIRKIAAVHGIGVKGFVKDQ